MNRERCRNAYNMWGQIDMCSEGYEFITSSNMLKSIFDMIVVLPGTKKTVYNGVYSLNEKVSYPLRYARNSPTHLVHHSKRGRDKEGEWGLSNDEFHELVLFTLYTNWIYHREVYKKTPWTWDGIK